MAITPDGKHVYVANNSDGTVSVITTATGAVSATIPVGNGPLRVAICPTPSTPEGPLSERVLPDVVRPLELDSRCASRGRGRPPRA